MTMPSKIYAVETNLPKDNPSGIWSERKFSTRSAYIRAEIAEELARAASKVTRSYRDETDGIISGMCELEDALTRYRAITP